MVDWTDEMVATLRQLVADGCSFGEAGRRMGIGKNSAIGKAQRLGLQSRFAPSGTVKPVWNAEASQPPPKPPAEKGAKTYRSVPKPPPPVRSPPPSVGSSPTCCWPLWGHRERPREYRFCGAASVVGQSWCPEHYETVFPPRGQQSGERREFKLRQLG